MYKTVWIDTYNITANSLCHFNMKKSLENLSTLCCKYPTASTKISNAPQLHCQNLMDVFQFPQNSARFSRNPTPTMPISTLCLLPARWGPRALDSQYSGNIARFWWISSNFVKTQLSIQMFLSSDPTTPEFTLCLPPARWGPREADPNAVAILPIFDGLLPISSKLNYLYKCNRHRTPKMPN